MTKQQNRGYLIALCVLVMTAILFLIATLMKELYLGYVLIRSESLNEILFFINNVPQLSKVYLVSLVKSMSDVNINLLKFLQALEIQHVIAPILLLLAFDINRVYFKKKIIKVGMIILGLSLLLKYLIVLIISFFITPSVMNPTILFEAVGFTLILQQIFVIISIILMFIGLFSLTRKEDGRC